MKCVYCEYDHGLKSGRLLALAPIYGMTKFDGDGVTNSWLQPGLFLAKDRWQRVECGALFECLRCGNKFGANGEGPFRLPQPETIPQQRTNGPAPEKKPEPPMRPAHFLDEDAALEPNL